MKRLVKVTIKDFSKIRENLENPADVSLYEAANGRTYHAEIEHDGYAVIDLPDEEYIELAPGEYQIMIEDWQDAGTVGEGTLQTKSDPADDTALLYRVVNGNGEELEPPRSLPKQVVQLLARTWFGTK